MLSIRLLLLMTILPFSLAIFADSETDFDISGWIDGEARTWIVQKDALTPSAVFSTLMPGSHQFHINAYRDQRFGREGSLYLEIMIQNGEVQSAQIQYFPFAPRHPRFSFGPDHGTGQLTVNSLNMESGRAHLSASFAGELHYHQSANTRPIPHRTRPIRINIDLTAVRD